MTNLDDKESQAVAELFNIPQRNSDRNTRTKRGRRNKLEH
jgi:hypothetical protein